MTQQPANSRIAFRPSPTGTRTDMVLFIVSMVFWVVVVAHADELSRVSGRPIQTEKVMQHPMPKVEVRKTWQQEQDDFAARAARVEARNAELLGETETPRGSSG